MKQDLLMVIELLTKINEQYNNRLVNEEKYEDFQENVSESLDTDFSKWEKSIEYLKMVDINKENFEEEESFRHGIAYLSMALLDISNDLNEMNELVVEMVQNLQKENI